MPALNPTFRRITAPAESAISLSEMRTHLRTEPHEDLYLENTLIPGVVMTTEKESSVALVNQVWELRLANWCQVIPLPIVPVQQVDSIEYLDDQEQPQTVNPNDYQLAERSIEFKRTFVFPKLSNEYTLGVIVVKWTAGFGPTCTQVPGDARHAMLLLGGHRYEHREAVVEGNATELPLGYRDLINSIREDYL